MREKQIISLELSEYERLYRITMSASGNFIWNNINPKKFFEEKVEKYHLIPLEISREEAISILSIIYEIYGCIVPSSGKNFYLFDNKFDEQCFDGSFLYNKDYISNLDPINYKYLNSISEKLKHVFKIKDEEVPYLFDRDPIKEIRKVAVELPKNFDILVIILIREIKLEKNLIDSNFHLNKKDILKKFDRVILTLSEEDALDLSNGARWILKHTLVSSKDYNLSERPERFYFASKLGDGSAILQSSNGVNPRQVKLLSDVLLKKTLKSTVKNPLLLILGSILIILSLPFTLISVLKKLFFRKKHIQTSF